MHRTFSNLKGFVSLLFISCGDTNDVCGNGFGDGDEADHIVKSGSYGDGKFHGDGLGSGRGAEGNTTGNGHQYSSLFSTEEANA